MALLACVPIYLLGQRRGMTPQILVLSGIVVLFFFQSLQSLLLFLASPEAMQQIVFWLFGSLLKANMHGVAITGGVLFCALVVSLRLAWRLTALSAGEEQAQGLGINVSALRKLAFLLATLLTAASVSFVGTIGFVGLIAPHFARFLVGGSTLSDLHFRPLRQPAAAVRVDRRQTGAAERRSAHRHRYRLNRRAGAVLLRHPTG